MVNTYTQDLYFIVLGTSFLCLTIRLKVELFYQEEEIKYFMQVEVSTYKNKKSCLVSNSFLLIMIIDLNYYLAAQISISNWISGKPRAVI